MRTKNIENIKRKEELILSAARKCFLSKGFHKTTMRDIAKEASISLGSIYQYYKGKNEIILKFVELSNQETTEAIEYIETAKNFKKALRDVLYAMLDDFVKKQELIIYLEILSEALKNKDVREIIKQEKTEDCFASLLNQASKNKKILLKIDSLTATHLLLSSVETAASSMMIHNKTYKKKNAQRYIDKILDLVL